MKNLKVIALALVSIICVQDAMAQTVMRLTGSTAFRRQTNEACRVVFDPGTLTYAYVSNGNDAEAFGAASRAIFKGLINGQPVIIKTSFSGSTGGMQNVTQGNAIQFLNDNTNTVNGGVNIPTLPAPPWVSEVPQVTMGDTYQSQTPFRNPEMDGTIVGVVAYGFAASRGTPAGVSNITSLQAQVLYVTGQLPVALFTGNPADQGVNMFSLGRNSDSGTRTAALAETGIGSNTPIIQWNPTLNGAGTDVLSHEWSDSDLDPNNGLDGNGGYSSGGTVASTLRANAFAATGGYYIGYIGTGDLAAATSVTSSVGAGPARALTYNGETYTIPNVQQGKYSFWTYQHVFTLATAPQAVKNVSAALASSIILQTAEIPFNTMAVQRQLDGGPIFPLY